MWHVSNIYTSAVPTAINKPWNFSLKTYKTKMVYHTVQVGQKINHIISHKSTYDITDTKICCLCEDSYYEMGTVVVCPALMHQNTINKT